MSYLHICVSAKGSRSVRRTERLHYTDSPQLNSYDFLLQCWQQTITNVQRTEIGTY
ncbi:MAG: hypothetical protein LBT09_12890 [Planctomycetaceae bacterium]|nr:hypothetical protein [Planctomycetaceae bacterium]